MIVIPLSHDVPSGLRDREFRMLEIKGVSRRFGSKTAVDDVNLAIAPAASSA